MHKSDPFLSVPSYNPDSLESTIEHFLKSRGIRVKYVARGSCVLVVGMTANVSTLFVATGLKTISAVNRSRRTAVA